MTCFMVLLSVIVCCLVVLGLLLFLQLPCNIYFSLKFAVFSAKGVIDVYLCICIRICSDMLEH